MVTPTATPATPRTPGLSGLLRDPEPPDYEDWPQQFHELAEAVVDLARPDLVALRYFVDQLIAVEDAADNMVLSGWPPALAHKAISLIAVATDR